MADHTIRRVSAEGVGYSVVDLNDVRHVFATAAARRGSTFREQADDALNTIGEAIRADGGGRSIVHQAVFLADPSWVEPCRRVMREFYGQDLPATSYIPQPPCDGKMLAIEALGVGRDRGEVEIQRLDEQVVIARHNGIAWVHCADIVPPVNGKGTYQHATCAFDRLGRLLDGVNVGFDRVIRTWLYLGGILNEEGAGQRYKELNRARTDFYQDIPFPANQHGSASEGSSRRSYPASTGIGAAGRGITLSAIALQTDREDIRCVALENPRQTSAFDYAAHYSPQSPKFSRAMALSCGGYATIFVSGTASIVSSETRHVGDAVAQTHETLDNIAALISEDTLRRHDMPGLGTSLSSLGLLRVYIKRPEDCAKVRAVCEQRIGELPAIYATADVCRSDLLVEIEGIAFSKADDRTR